MRLYLERIEPENGLARFYVMAIEPTLLGDWAVIREWGRIGQPGTVRSLTFSDAATARDEVEAMIARKEHRGYRVRETPATGG